MKHVQKLGLITIFSFLFLIPIIFGVLLPNKIINGDFETYDKNVMSRNGSVNVLDVGITGSSWQDLQLNCNQTSTFTNRSSCVIMNQTFCSQFGFRDSCVELSSNRSVEQIGSPSFTWLQSDNSTFNLQLQFSALTTNTSATLQITEDDLSRVTTCTFSGGTITSTNVTQFFNINVNCLPWIIGHTYTIGILTQTSRTVYLDNVTFDLSNATTTKLTSDCETGYANSTFINNTATCITPSIDLSQCTSVSNPSLTVSGSLWTDCPKIQNFTSTWTQFSPTFTNISANTGCTSQLGVFGNYNPVTNFDFPAYLNNYTIQDSFYGNCGLYANNSFLYNIFCEASVICQINQTTNCQRLCLNGFEFLNGTYDTATGTCINFVASSQCKTFTCGNITECLENTNNLINFTFVNQTLPTFTLNTTGLVANVLTIFTTPLGYTLYILLILELMVYFFTNEFFTIILYTILNFIFGFLGFFPSWVGILSGTLGLQILLLLHEKFE